MHSNATDRCGTLPEPPIRYKGYRMEALMRRDAGPRHKLKDQGLHLAMIDISLGGVAA
jgi:hypothetical protein